MDKQVWLCTHPTRNRPLGLAHCVALPLDQYIVGCDYKHLCHNASGGPTSRRFLVYSASLNRAYPVNADTHYM